MRNWKEIVPLVLGIQRYGGKNEKIYSEGVIPQYLFIKRKRMASREAKEIRCRKQ